MFMKNEILDLGRRCRYCGARAAVLATTFALGGLCSRAQESPQAPLPPPPEHHVHRMSTTPDPPAPPSLPPEEIIRKFSQKEDQFLSVRPAYAYRKSIRIDEFGEDG